MANDQKTEATTKHPMQDEQLENGAVQPAKNKTDEAVDVPNQGSSSPMGGENNVTGNSSDRQGDSNNSSGGSYRKSNKEI